MRPLKRENSPFHLKLRFLDFAPEEKFKGDADKIMFKCQMTLDYELLQDRNKVKGRENSNNSDGRRPSTSECNRFPNIKSGTKCVCLRRYLHTEQENEVVPTLRKVAGEMRRTCEAFPN